MAITKTPRLDQTRWSSGQDLVKREDFDSDASELETNVALFKEGPLSSRPAAGVHGRFYTVVGDSNAALNGRQFYDNGSQWAALSYTNNLLAEAISVGDTAAVVRAQLSPTANIFAVQNSASQNHLVVTPTGYTTTQRTPGTSGGVELGYDTTHNQAGLFVSVAAAKPVVVIRGVAGQNANYLELFSSDNQRIAFLDQAGGATFTGSLTTNLGITSSGPISAPSITSNGPSNLIDAVITSGGQDHVGLTVRAATNQSTNLVEIKNAGGTRTARFVQDGTFATDGRINVGGGQGNSGSVSYGATDAVASLTNSLNSAAPVLNLFANPTGQTANILQVFDTLNTLKFWVDQNGNTSANGIQAATVAVGATAPTPYYNSTTPRFEVVTGSASGAYNEGVTLRHSSTSAAAVSRELGLQIKLSNELNQTESNKWAGVTAFSTFTNSSNVGLALYTNGTRAMTIDSVNNVIAEGDITIDNSKALRFHNGGYDRIFFNDDVTTGTMGMQTGRTMYMRSDNIALYSGGVYNTNGLNAGGGVTMAQFTPDRTLLKKLTLQSATAFDSTAPVLQIGTTQHMQFSAATISVYDDVANTVPSALNLAYNGGQLRLGNGNSIVSVPSRMMWWGNIDDTGTANAVVFGRSSAGNYKHWTGRNPINGDWWFDHTTNHINVYDGSTWHVFQPDYTSDDVTPN